MAEDKAPETSGSTFAPTLSSNEENIDAPIPESLSAQTIANLQLAGAGFTLVLFIVVYIFWKCTKKTRIISIDNEPYSRLPQAEGDIELGVKDRASDTEHDDVNWDSDWDSPKKNSSNNSINNLTKDSKPTYNSPHRSRSSSSSPANVPNNQSSNDSPTHSSNSFSAGNNNNSKSVIHTPIAYTPAKKERVPSKRSIPSDDDLFAVSSYYRITRMPRLYTYILINLYTLCHIQSIGIAAKPTFQSPLKSPPSTTNNSAKGGVSRVHLVASQSTPSNWDTDDLGDIED